MKSGVWAKVVRASADPERVRRSLELLRGTEARSAIDRASEENARMLAAVLSGSSALASVLIAHPEWIEVLRTENLGHARRGQGFRQALEWLEPSIRQRDFAGSLKRLREFKQRELLRIAARDLARLAHTSEIIGELSDLADACLSAVWEICYQQAVDRFGTPWHQTPDGRWQKTEFCILGLGKLGGQELNYSSDVDVLFVYGDEGQVLKEPPGKGRAAPRSTQTTHQFFNRAAEVFISEVSRATPEGVLFRIDLRLRPEGDSGPLCRSLAGYENYYAQWGQTWERMMLIKARCTAGSESLAGEFIEMIQPFRFPRSINPGVLREIGAMKDRIEREVVGPEELERNVKLGRGGIREIEFVAQSQQLLHGGKVPFIQGRQTVPTLEKLAEYHLLPDEDSTSLTGAYYFLRDVEHRLQMEENLQTHTIPTSRPARERLAKLMGFKNLDAFEKALRAHTSEVRQIFRRILQADNPAAPSEFPRDFTDSEARWKVLLKARGFRDPDAAVQRLREFVEGPGYVHVSPRTIELAHDLLPRLFALTPMEEAAAARQPEKAAFRLSDPDRVLTRLDSFIAAYGARAVLFELWNANPAIFELLVKLFDRSEFLAELAIRTPDLVDELVTSGRLRQRKTAEETLSDLRHGLGDADQFEWLRRYHEVEVMRIGLRDILGLADPEQYRVELSALADACLQYAFEVAVRHHRLRAAPFVVIGMGKLGGVEIDYGSDLDIVFVADGKPGSLRAFQQVALQVMELLSRRTELGIVFQTDARLRPDGEKGLLVNTLSAYEEYYRQRAQLWEIQSLTRARPIAGDAQTGATFQELARRLTDFRPENVRARFGLGKPRRSTKLAGDGPTGLAAYTPEWKHAIHRMRMRIERERTPSGKDDLAIKTGSGGLMDAEFLAQALCLEHGWQQANSVRALERACASGVLPRGVELLENYLQLRRLEGILRRWSYAGETVLPDDSAAFYRVAIRCGFNSADEFRQALKQWRTTVRSVYAEYFEIPTA